MWKQFHPDPREVIDLASSKHFAYEKHQIQYVNGERPEWVEFWWTVDHVSVKYSSSKLSSNLVSLTVSNNFGIEYFQVFLSCLVHKH